MATKKHAPARQPESAATERLISYLEKQQYMLWQIASTMELILPEVHADPACSALDLARENVRQVADALDSKRLHAQLMEQDIA